MQTVLRIVCWGGAAYFFGLANFGYGYPPDWTGNPDLCLLVALVLFLLPFAQEFSLTGVFSFKAKVDEVKRDVSDFKSEIREQIKIQNSNISSVSNSVVVQLPGSTDALNAERDITQRQPSAMQRFSNSAEDLRGLLVDLTEHEQRVMMTGVLSVLEYELRRILNYSTSLKPKGGHRYRALGSLWSEFKREHPDLSYLDTAMRFAMDVGNAAVHGQRIPLETAVETILFKDEILKVLRDL